jgi:hypothetical protein
VCSQGRLGLTVDDVASPEGLFTSEAGAEADFLIRAFFDNLETIRGFGEEDGGESRNVEGFTRQLLFDFMRILVLANKESLRKSVNATVQMMYRPVQKVGELMGSPPGQRTFDTADAKYIVANDGSFGALVNDDKRQKVVKNLPISFEVCLQQNASLIADYVIANRRRTGHRTGVCTTTGFSH